MENTVFSWANKLMKIWYLLITEKFLVWTFQRWEIRSFFSQKIDGKMIFIDYWKVLILNFSEMGNTVFFGARKLMERWYLLGLFYLSMIFQDLGNMVFREMCWVDILVTSVVSLRRHKRTKLCCIATSWIVIRVALLEFDSSCIIF